MNALPHRLIPRPTLSLQALVWLTRVIWWLVLLLCVLGAAVWAGLQFFIVPRIDSLRPVLEIQATQMLGRPLRIGAIHAETEGRLLPAFELREVMLHERAGPDGSTENPTVAAATGDTTTSPALHLSRVRVELSLTALLRMGFERLLIEQPDLTVRRMADGRIFVAGIEVQRNDGGDNRVMDWVLSQSEWRITGGRVHWIDETRAVKPVDLQGLEFRLRNGARAHEWRLDAQAPAELGGRVSLRGSLREPLLFARAGEWQRWDGTLYAELERVDLEALKQRISWPEQLAHIQAQGGSGALRAWVDVEEGRIDAVTVDVALKALALRLAPTLPALDLNRFAGRIGARWGQSLGGALQDGSYEIYTERLRFDTRDGLVWPGGDASVSLAEYRPGRTLGALRVQDIDLAVLADLARYLPLSPQAHQALQDYAPQGRIERFQANWQGVTGGMPDSYEVQGRVVGLKMAAQAAANPQSHATPGISGVTFDFDANQDGGSAQVQVRQGYVDLPDWFEPARLTFDPLSADLRWKLKGGEVDSLQIQSAKIANADMQGDFQLEWKAARAPTAAADPGAANAKPAADRGPGQLDLQGSFSRVDLAALHRYLPRALPQSARSYLHSALPQGRASQVRVRLRGDLSQFPFRQGAGEFRVTAQVQGAKFVYVPPALQPAGQLPWPALENVEGEFVMERGGLLLRNFSAGIAGAAQLHLLQSQVRIPDLGGNLRVQTDLNFTGALDDMLQRMVVASPLDFLRDGVLHQVRATGDAAVRLRLDLPINDLDNTTVQGQLLLTGNTLRPAPGLPALTQTRGVVHFSERGFALSAVNARLLGGEVQAEGGTMPVPGALTLQSFQSPSAAPAPRLRVRGQLTAQGLRQAGQEDANGGALHMLATLARQMEGGTRYEAEFGLDDGAPEFWLRTDLRGLALSLPAPMRKPADAAWPVRVQLERKSAPVTAQDETGRRWRDLLSLDVGRLLNVRYEREHEAGVDRPRVLRGAMQLDLSATGPEPATPSPSSPQRGGETIALPDSGVRAQLRLGVLDLNAWEEVADDGVAARKVSAPPAAAQSAATGTAENHGPAWLDYLPTQLRLQGERVQAGRQSLSQIDVEATREHGTWHAKLAAQELNGDVTYRMPAQSEPQAANAAQSEDGVKEGAGFLHVRLARWVLSEPEEANPSSNVKASDTAGDSDDPAFVHALSLPAMDVVIEQLQLGNKRLGRVEMEADHALMSVPAAAAASAAPVPVASSTAVWVWQLKRLRIQLPEAEFTARGQWPVPAAAPTPRRSSVNFELTVKDAGGLLARLGKPGLINAGAGFMRGQLGWPGLPWKPAVAALDGSLRINVEQGQFLKVDPGAAKLLGVLSLQSLPRRLMFDFRDAFSDGFSFDFVRGNVRLAQGVARTNNLQMKGVVAAVLMSGQADLGKETQDLRVVIVPEINAGTASLIAAWINPAVGLTTFLAQAVLRRPAIAAATQEYHITGTWSQPQMEKVDRDKADREREERKKEDGKAAPPARDEDEEATDSETSGGAQTPATPAPAPVPSSP